MGVAQHDYLYKRTVEPLLLVWFSVYLITIMATAIDVQTTAGGQISEENVVMSGILTKQGKN